MNRGDAYAILSRELSSWRSHSYDYVLASVEQPASSKIVRIGGEDMTVTVSVRWADTKKKILRVDAVADGPSCWNLQRLEESITVGPSPLPER